MSNDLSSLFQESDDDAFFASIEPHRVPHRIELHPPAVVIEQVHESNVHPTGHQFPPIPEPTVIHSEHLHVSHPGMARARQHSSDAAPISEPTDIHSGHLHVSHPGMGSAREPASPPSSAPMSLIAARRLNRKTEELFKPEQDIIYNKPSIGTSLPPPPMVHVASPVASMAHVAQHSAHVAPHGAYVAPAGAHMVPPTAHAVGSPSVVVPPLIAVPSHMPPAHVPAAPHVAESFGASSPVHVPGPFDMAPPPHVAEPFVAGSLNMTGPFDMAPPLHVSDSFGAASSSTLTSQFNMAPPAYLPHLSAPPMVGPAVSPRAPLHVNDPYLMAPVVPRVAAPFPHASFPVASHAPPLPESKRPSMRAIVSFGFGGRIVVAGGRLGSRVKLSTLKALLGDAKWVQDIETGPGPLGTVSGLTTECVSSFLNRPNADASFSWSSIPDSEYMSKYLLGDKFFSNLGVNLSTQYNSETLRPLLTSLVQGDMRAAIQFANTHPQVYPIVMALASIHSAEFFRESILALAANESNEWIQFSAQDRILLSVLKKTITVFASTSPLFPPIDAETLQHWKLYLALVGSFTKTGGSGGSQFLSRLGSALVAEGHVVAGQLCMLVAQPRLDSVDSVNACVCLIGVDHKRNVARLLDPYALQISEIFEYMQRLNGAPFFVGLQPFKFAYAAMLAGDLGLFDLAEKYLTVINAFVKAVPTGQFSSSFRAAIRELEDRINGATKHIVRNENSSFSALWAGILGR